MSRFDRAPVAGERTGNANNVRAERADLGLRGPRLGGTSVYAPIVVDPDGRRHRLYPRTVSGRVVGDRKSRAVKVTSADGTVKFVSPTDGRKPFNPERKRAVVQAKHHLAVGDVTSPRAAKPDVVLRPINDGAEYGRDYT